MAHATPRSVRLEGRDRIPTEGPLSWTVFCDHQTVLPTESS